MTQLFVCLYEFYETYDYIMLNTTIVVNNDVIDRVGVKETNEPINQ